MKRNIILKGLSVAAAVMAFTSCEDFLNRPAEDSYNVDNFYKNDAQCEQGVNYMYNSPWYDFQRGFIKVGEVMSGICTGAQVRIWISPPTVLTRTS